MSNDSPLFLPDTCHQYSDVIRGIPDVSLTTMERKHLPAVAKLWDERIGTPPGSRNPWLEHAIDDTHPTKGFVAVTNDAVIGFGIATIGGPEWAAEYINHPDADVACWRDTGVLHSLAVNRLYESQGVGTALFAIQLEYLTAVGADGVIGVSWHRDNHYDSRPLFSKFEFIPDSTHPDFYAVTAGHTYCVDCEGTCTCGSTVFVRELPSSRSEIQSTIYP